MIKAKSQFKRRSTANNVEIVIPVPADADSPKYKTTVGNIKYAPEQNAITWTIKSFPVSDQHSPIKFVILIQKFLTHCSTDIHYYELCGLKNNNVLMGYPQKVRTSHRHGCYMREVTVLLIKLYFLLLDRVARNTSCARTSVYRASSAKTRKENLQFTLNLKSRTSRRQAFR